MIMITFTDYSSLSYLSVIASEALARESALGEQIEHHFLINGTKTERSSGCVGYVSLSHGAPSLFAVRSTLT